MRKLYYEKSVFFILLLISFIPQKLLSQTCDSLITSYAVTESRCAATGAIQINATGGSGNYQYKVSGPVSTNYTSSNDITGLSAGVYLVTILDINTNCVYSPDSVTVPGNYITPGFSMVSSNVTCMNGSDGTITVTGQSFGRAPFSYQIVAPSASNIGAISVSGFFSGLTSGDYSIQLTDSCGGIQTRIISLTDYNWFINNYNVVKIGCDSITVTINLKDGYGNVTSNAAFNGFLYGASVTAGDTTWYSTNSFTYFIGNQHTVHLFVKDLCGNIHSVIWVDPLIPNVNATVLISDKTCTDFTATITGQVNLTTPGYCLYDTSNTLLSCNSTGIFNSLPYGNYCIKVTNTCYDTIITRCFSASISLPAVAANVNIVAVCNSFTASVTGQVNLTNPYYCLYDSSDILLQCDSTGVFTGLPFGTYCIKVTNDPLCFDSTIIRCFTVNQPIPAAGINVVISNLTCATFTASITDTSNWNNPQFCLYTTTHVLITCNSTGIFNDLPFDSYCIEITNGAGCYDTTMSRCFTVNKRKPSVNAAVSISNRTCTGFTATVTGQTNLTNPQYCLYDSTNTLLGCNTSGVFANITYGIYTIKIENDSTCYDTTIVRSFTVRGIPVDLTISAKKSCASIGSSDIKVTITSGIPSYSISLFSPTGTLIQTVTTASNNYTFIGMPNLLPLQRYKVVITDQCNNKDSLTITPVVSVVQRDMTLTPKCPSAVLLTGYADLLVDITNNNVGGVIKPVIIKKNGVVVTMNATFTVGYKYYFFGLEPATYIFDTYVTDCNLHMYDTVVVRPYFFPELTGSRAYQCDNGSIEINVNAVNGIAPYQYEIFGSTPSTPSILAGPQSSPTFSINNGTSYSLIRLRLLDGCGNASLKDVSVLPLGSFHIFADNLECYNHDLTLSVDSIQDATYAWYKRIPPNDSVLISTNASYFIPNLQAADTGNYFCIIVINGGCVTRIANYHLKGYCGTILPVNVHLSGIKQAQGNKLSWTNGQTMLNGYSLQRSPGSALQYQTLQVYSGVETQNYFVDDNPLPGANFYRLMFKESSGAVKYSNVIYINSRDNGITVFPNPVNDMINISFANKLTGDYRIEINSMQGRKLWSKNYYRMQSGILNIPRNSSLSTGMYSLAVKNLQTGETQVIKLIFR